MGDQNPKAYVHKGGVRILSYLDVVNQQRQGGGWYRSEGLAWRHVEVANHSVSETHW
jgi:hypothetical protein